MATQLINVIVNSKGMVTVQKQLNAIGDSARKTASYMNGLRTILTAALAFSGAGAIVETIDTFTVLQNRLRQVSDASNTVGDSWNKLLDIANNSYSTIDGTVNLYFRVAQAYKAWGESAEAAYEFTDLFQKSAILSGSSMQTTAQAVYQFSQALNKGKLDGDEFRSVLEGLPYVASLIQKSLGVTRAELYKMSRDGRISVDQIKRAFEDAAETINSDWKNITPTIGMALVVLKNNWTDFVGEIQTSTGIFSGIAYLILAVAHNFDLLAIALAPVVISMGFLAGRLGLGLVIMGLKDLAEVLKLAAAAQWLFNAAVTMNPYVLAAVAIAALIAAIIYFRNEIGLTNENLLIVWNTVVLVFTSVIQYLVQAVTYMGSLLMKFIEWSGVWEAIKAVATATWNVISTIFTSIGKLVAKAASYIYNAFIPVWREIVEVVVNLWGLIQELSAFISKELVRSIKALKPAWEVVWGVLEPALKWVLGVMSDILDGWKLIANWLKGTFAGVVKDVFDGWILILRKVVGFINDIISALRAALRLMSQVSGGASGGGTPGAHYGMQGYVGEFANGGNFKVGGTNSGRDTTPVSFRAERGERVTVETKKQQRANDNAGGVTNVNVPLNITNVLDPDMVVQANQTAAGARSIINVLRNNREEFQQILGVA